MSDFETPIGALEEWGGKVGCDPMLGEKPIYESY